MNTFPLEYKTANIGKMQKSKNIAVIKVLNRLLYNLNNGFHQQGKKF